MIPPDLADLIGVLHRTRGAELEATANRGLLWAALTIHRKMGKDDRAAWSCIVHWLGGYCHALATHE